MSAANSKCDLSPESTEDSGALVDHIAAVSKTFKAVSNISSQFEMSNLCECINSRTVFYIVRLNLSHCPFPCGWYGVEVEMLIPISFKYLLIDVDINPDPLSECIVLGVPNVANNSWYIFITVFDEVSFTANAQGNLLNSSTMVNMYLFFEVFDLGKGP